MANLIVPCFSLAESCRADWAAISAIGGWLGAAGAFAAAYVALLLAAAERTKREAEHKAASKFAMLGLWPRLHRAQSDLTGIAYAIGKDEDAPDSKARADLLTLIDSLEAELKAINALGVALDAESAERLAAASSIAGYVARQARRIAAPENSTMLNMLWYQGAIRLSWAEDARTAAGHLLAFASVAENVVNSISGRVAPTYAGSE
ncbi:hypothetical protein Q2B95_08100 [Stenotrophomonas maltophilia]|uniref:hypothetical protein n=1 Tax=Stenotrophomonas maltophilia TaxID=40324 RepID=UPI00309669FB